VADFELYLDFRKSLLALDRRNGDLKLLGVVVPRASSQLPFPSQHQTDKPMALSSPFGPLYELNPAQKR